MQDTIEKQLGMIEEDHQVKVLYACESGSRAWGFPSKDSDYDVRFIYIHTPEWYLSIDEKRDVIELPINELLDINGWDIRKALKLFRKSNPPLQEWLQSSIVYHEKSNFPEQVRQLSSEVFSPVSCMHHYLSMAKGNYREYLQGPQVKIKKYFYVLRPILACLWIEKFRGMPPIMFQELVQELVREPDLMESIDQLLERKISGDELDLEPRIQVINEFIETQIAHIESVTASITHQSTDPTPRLDALFRNTLREVWDKGASLC